MWEGYQKEFFEKMNLLVGLGSTFMYMECS